jgi:hypothetical protein
LIIPRVIRILLESKLIRCTPITIVHCERIISLERWSILLCEWIVERRLILLERWRCLIRGVVIVGNEWVHFKLERVVGCLRRGTRGFNFHATSSVIRDRDWIDLEGIHLRGRGLRRGRRGLKHKGVAGWGREGRSGSGTGRRGPWWFQKKRIVYWGSSCWSRRGSWRGGASRFDEEWV